MYQYYALLRGKIFGKCKKASKEDFRKITMLICNGYKYDYARVKSNTCKFLSFLTHSVNSLSFQLSMSIHKSAIFLTGDIANKTCLLDSCLHTFVASAYLTWVSNLRTLSRDWHFQHALSTHSYPLWVIRLIIKWR